MRIYLITISIFLGVSVGSFVNASIYRLFHNKSIVKGRSQCVKCNKIIAWYDLIPVFSYLVLLGKCRKCKQKISIQYFLMEVITGILFGLATWIFLGQSNMVINLNFLLLLRNFIIIASLLFLFVYDLKYYLLPDIVTIPSIVIIFIINLLLGINVLNMLIGVIIGAGFFAFQYIISKGKWVGGGDLRMGALMGVILGWPVVLVGLFIAYVVGAVFALALVCMKKKKFGEQLPFGTFLAVSTLASLWWGVWIINIYLGYI